MTDYSANPTEDSPEVLRGCLWALATGGGCFVLFLMARIAILRVEIGMEEGKLRESERTTLAVENQRDAARRDAARQINELTESLQKSEAARLSAERDAQMAVMNAARPVMNAPRSSVPAMAAPAPAASVAGMPSALELTSFIKEHLSRMMGPVEGQVADYADDVAFHDKPHATQRVIENERWQLGQKYPVRVIFKDEIQPQISVLRDAVHGWMALATFDWRWECTSRTGKMNHGVTRDTWKIVPSAQGLKIVSEKSADPVSGQSKD